MMLKLVLVGVLIGIVVADRNPNYDEIGRVFQALYASVVQSPTTLDDLDGIYKDDSIILLEGHEYKGFAQITRKLKALKISERTVKTMDILAAKDGSIIIDVVGEFKVNESDPVSFFQTFIIKQTEEEQWYCSEEIFRLT